jgi:hypothetical protein
MIRHVSDVAEVVDDILAAVRFHRSELGMDVDFSENEPYAVVHAPGMLHFGLWDRRFAAERILGDASRTKDVPSGLLLRFKKWTIPLSTTVGCVYPDGSFGPRRTNRGGNGQSGF